MIKVEQVFINDSPMVTAYKQTLRKFRKLHELFLDSYAKIQGNNNVLNGTAGSFELF